MKSEPLQKLLEEHAFFKGLDTGDLELFAGCASNVAWKADEKIFREGEPADRFFLLRFGRCAVETFAPGRGNIIIQTVEPGSVLGWSWLVPPYRFHMDARALEVTRALAFDGACLRRKCDAEPRLGYELMQRCVQIIANRLHSTQMQLVDVYGTGGTARP